VQRENEKRLKREAVTARNARRSSASDHSLTAHCAKVNQASGRLVSSAPIDGADAFPRFAEFLERAYCQLALSLLNPVPPRRTICGQRLADREGKSPEHWPATLRAGRRARVGDSHRLNRRAARSRFLTFGGDRISQTCRVTVRRAKLAGSRRAVALCSSCFLPHHDLPPAPLPTRRIC
jgi:hypothetical protein